VKAVERSGVRTGWRRNYQVDIEWKDGKVTDYQISSTDPRPVTVRVNGETMIVKAVKL
jgi:alpha-L-fucosidase 2